MRFARAVLAGACFSLFIASPALGERPSINKLNAEVNQLQAQVEALQSDSLIVIDGNGNELGLQRLLTIVGQQDPAQYRRTILCSLRAGKCREFKNKTLAAPAGREVPLLGRLHYSPFDDDKLSLQ